MAINKNKKLPEFEKKLYQYNPKNQDSQSAENSEHVENKALDSVSEYLQNLYALESCIIGHFLYRYEAYLEKKYVDYEDTNDLKKLFINEYNRNFLDKHKCCEHKLDKINKILQKQSEQISVLQESQMFVSEKDNEILALKSIIEQKDLQIASMSKKVKEKDEIIDSLEANLYTALFKICETNTLA